MINSKQLREYIVRPALVQIGLHTDAAENLIMGTIAQESAGGEYLHQIRGPALGVCQMEPATHDLCWQWLDWPQRYPLRAAVSGLLIQKPPRAKEMIWNLHYAVAMSRVLYRSIPYPLPDADDVPGLAAYWKRFYNTPKGRGTEAEFIRNYERYVS